MISRNQAIEAVLEYLGRGLRIQLMASPGWPHDAMRTSGGESKAVWSVFVASDVTGVGAGHYIILDADTGEVVSDQWCDE
ncbi:MAG: hypothetical protein ACRDFS_09605 [Chloroflexota bacterium]